MIHGNRSIKSALLRAFTTDTTCKLNILGHDGDALGVNGTQVGIFEQPYKVGLGSFLQGKDGRTLKPKVALEILCDFSYQTLEGKLAN